MKKSFKNQTTDWLGLFYAALIIVSWTLCLLYCLFFFKINLQNIFANSLLILTLTFLYTGLFIQAHDAMHGSLAPKWPKLNNFVGRLCVILYAAFSYKKLKNEHLKHHAHVASHEDPDYSSNLNFIFWYYKFMQHYLTLKQIFIMTIIAQILQHFCRVPLTNIICFWALPAILSTLQLFYFGTYLPHKKNEAGYANEHCCISLEYPAVWSFLACYHFGYHYEHHSNPQAPWWKLPELKASSQKLTRNKPGFRRRTILNTFEKELASA